MRAKISEWGKRAHGRTVPLSFLLHTARLASVQFTTCQAPREYVQRQEEGNISFGIRLYPKQQGVRKCNWRCHTE